MSGVFRVLGAELNAAKNVSVALQKVYGVGPWKAQTVCAALGLNPQAKLESVRAQLPLIQQYVEANFPAKPHVLRQIAADITLKIKIHSYAGQRHQYCLPLNGQKNVNARMQRRSGVVRARLLNFPLAKPKKQPTPGKRK